MRFRIRSIAALRLGALSGALHGSAVPSLLRLRGLFAITIALLGFASVFALDWNLEDRAIGNAASTATRLIQGFLEPLVQSMVSGPLLTAEEKSNLDSLLVNPTFRSHVVNLKIWYPDGTVVYSDEKELEGSKFGLHDELLGAFKGKVTTELSEPHSHKDHSAFIIDFPIPIVEVHAPLHATGLERVIGAAEFVIDANVLSKDLREARAASLERASFFGLLASIAAAAAIRDFMLRRRHWKSAAHRTRDEFLLRSQEAAAVKPAPSKSMREIIADLHDGPAQLLALACLKLDELGRSSGGSIPKEEINAVRGVTGHALDEIRGIMQMSVGPELDQMSLEETLKLAASMHAARTRSAVAINIAPLPPVGIAVKRCLFQFLREGLSNAFWHADGEGQAVTAHCKDGILVVEVADSGGASKRERRAEGGGLGLDGLAERLKSNGGRLDLFRSKSAGTRLVATFSLERERADS